MLGCKHRKGVVESIHLLGQGQPLNQLQDLSFHIRHEVILSTLASRYVFAHTRLYHTFLPSIVEWLKKRKFRGNRKKIRRLLLLWKKQEVGIRK